MERRGEEGMDFTPDEALLVARRLVARQAMHPEHWLEWEDFPELGEFAFGRLAGKVRAVGARLLKDTEQAERSLGIDAADLIERAS